MDARTRLGWMRLYEQLGDGQPTLRHFAADAAEVVALVPQYTAIDDGSRYRVLGVYPRRRAAGTLDSWSD